MAVFAFPTKACPASAVSPKLRVCKPSSIIPFKIDAPPGRTIDLIASV